MGSFGSPLGSLWIEIGAKISAFESAMADVSKQIDTTIKDAEDKFAGFDKLGSKLSGIGTSLSIAVTAPLLGVGAAALKASGDFDAAMKKVSAQGDITGKDLEGLKVIATDLGAKTQFSSKQAAEGMIEFASAGFKASEVGAAMKGTLDLAAAATSSVGDAAKLTKDVIGQFGLTANDTTHIADVLTATMKEGSSTLGELASGFKLVGPIAKTAGLSLEQTSAALVVLDKAGLRGTEAATGLRGTLASLLSPSSEAAKAMAELGIKVADSSGKLLPFSNVADQFKKALAGMSSEQERMNTLFTIFGREAAPAAISLFNAGGAAIDGLTTKFKASNGEAAKTAEVMNSGLNGALERMKGSIETAAQKIGDVLAPSIIALASYLEGAANKVAEFATWFEKLPAPVQGAALAFTALIAAAGPMLLIAGQMASAISSINTVLPLLSGGLATATRALGLTTAALGAWTAGITIAVAAVGTLIYAYQQMSSAQATAESSQKSYEDSLKILESRLRAHGADISALTKEYRDGVISQDAYAKKLRDLAKSMGDVEKPTKAASSASTELQNIQKNLATQLAQVTKSTTDAAKAHETYGVTADTAAKKDEVLFAMAAQLESAYKKKAAAIAASKLALSDVASTIPKVIAPTEELNQSINNLIASAKQIQPAFMAALQTDQFNKLKQQADDAGKAITKIADAYETLGVKSSASLADEAKKAQDAYAIIRESGTASARDIQAAWAKAEEARIKAAEAAGQKIPQSHKDALDKIEQDLGISQGKQKDKWEGFTKQVSTIVSDFSKGVADLIFGGDDTNDRLKEQENDLRASLKERETAFQEYQSSYASSLAEVRQAYADDLASQEEDFQSSLAERASDFADYQQEIYKKIGDLRADHQKEAEKERQDVLDSLDDRTKDFGDYQDDVSDNIDEIRRKAQESTDKEVKDLRESLADKKKDYDRYVEDINTKIARLRDKNKGQSSEEEKDLLTSLQRRTEDYKQYQDEIAAKIAEFSQKTAAAADRDVAEQQKALDRKQRDYEEYKAGVQGQLDAITQKHAEAQAKEEADLLTSLGKKQKDYEDFKTKASQTFEDNRAEAAKKLSEQESDLHASLQKQTAEYEKYKQSVAQKLKELEDQHQGFFDRVGNIFGGIFENAGKAITRFVTEELTGKLFKELGNLVDVILPGVGKAIGGIFGGSIGSIGGVAGSVGGAAGNVGGAAGGAAGSAGSAGSSAAGSVASTVTGVVGAIGSIGSFITGLIGNFQNAQQEKTLNAIEESTRYVKIWTGEQSQSILWSTQTTAERLNYVNDSLDDIRKKMIDWVSPIDGKLQLMLDATGWAQKRFDEISNNTYWGSAAEKDNTSALQAIRSALENKVAPSITIYIDGKQADKSAVRLEMQGAFGL